MTAFKTKGNYFAIRIAKIREDYDPEKHGAELTVLIMRLNLFKYANGSYISNNDPKNASAGLKIFGFDKPEDAYVFRLSLYDKDGEYKVDAKYLKGDDDNDDVFIYALRSIENNLGLKEEFAVAISRILRAAWESNCDESTILEVADDLENASFEGEFSAATAIPMGSSLHAGGVFVEVIFAENAPAKVDESGMLDFGRVEVDKYVNVEAGFVFTVY